MKKLFSTLVVFLLCAMTLSIAFADGSSTADPYYTDEFTVEYNADPVGNYNFLNTPTFKVSSVDTGKIKVSLYASTNETMQKLGFTSLKVQRWNGTSWVTDEEVTNQYSYNTNAFNYTNIFTGLYSGYQYRVRVTLRARRVPGEVQDLTITSDSIICH